MAAPVFSEHTHSEPVQAGSWRFAKLVTHVHGW